MKTQAIGVFDSGIGGITVLKDLVSAFPNESFVYLGDTARLPYGTKSPETIRKYSEQIITFLIQKNVKAVVIACNSASSQFTESEWKGIPIYNVIDPGSKLAASVTKNKLVGVLGTKATISSGAYQKKISFCDSSIQVHAVTCPLFVPLAEEGMYDGEITKLVVDKYMHSLKQQNVDTVVLGCTHYPLLASAIQDYMGKNVSLVSSGQAVTMLLQEDFKSNRLHPAADKNGVVTIYTTDASDHFNLLSQQIMSPLKVDRFEQIDL